MPRHGIITEVKADQAMVTTVRRGVCDECGDCGSCALEIGMGKNVPDQVLVNNPIGARVGDYVEFDLAGHAELKLSALIWIVPVIGMVTGAVLGDRLFSTAAGSSDQAALLGAVLGLVITFIPLMIYDRLVARDQRLVPAIIRRVPAKSCSILGSCEPAANTTPSNSSSA